MNNTYLTGKLLLAMPNMGDPRFHKAVIYVCLHDGKGAMGLVINHPLPGMVFGDLVGQLSIELEGEISAKIQDMPVMSGGPVESGRGFILHNDAFKQEDTIVINDDFSITGTVDALKDTANGKGPEKLVFALGYAGWSAGQLDQEMQHNAWLTLDASPALVFETDPDDMWDRAVHVLGVDPGFLSDSAGRA